MILPIIGVLAALTFLVVIHELGHFIVAKRNGIKVNEFGVGFPPRLFAKTHKGTDYSVNALPIGGFVSIKGEDGEEKGTDSYATKGARVKLKVLLAGVTINFLFAYLLITVLLAFGMANVFQFSLPNTNLLKQHKVGSENIRVVAVSPNSAAEQAGLKTGDNITSINGVNVGSTEQLRELTKSAEGREVTVVYVRDGETKNVAAKLGDSQEQGFLGVATIEESRIRYSIFAAPIVGFIACVKLAWATLAAFGSFIAGLLTRAQVSRNVAGPIGITAAIPKLQLFGFDYLLLLLAQISLSLAVVNALPISPLDGGKALLVILRRIGVNVTKKVESVMQFAGFGFLIIIMIIVTANDIIHLR